MSGPNQIRKPLAVCSVNSRTRKEQKGKKQVEKRPRAVARRAKKNAQTAEKANRCQANEDISYGPYTPLGPRIDHQAQALLPWDDDEASIVQIFELFWDERAIECIVQQTNAYAAEKRMGLGGRWKKVRGVEIRLFLALLIHMGARRGMGSKGFWSEVERNLIFRAMSLRRFLQIKRYLHISDPKYQLTRSEWFQKLEPLNSLIRDRCQQYYLPSSNVTVDEMMIRFGGRSHHTYRMPSKPIKEGYKVFALCDVGYTYNWIFASRSDSFVDLVLQPDLMPTGSAVFQLATALPYSSGLHFNIYMDNYFPSVALLERLRDRGLGGCGTARVNSKAFPPALHDPRSNIPWNELSGGSASTSGKVLAVQWQDNSAVHFLTTIHNLTDRIVTERKKPRLTSSNGPAIRRAFGIPERVRVSIPVITNDYNQYKVEVDVADQYRSYYYTQLKCLRNWPPIFYWLLDTTIINSYLLTQRLPPPYQYQSSSRTFRLLLAESLFKLYGQKHKKPRKSYYTRKTTALRYSKQQQTTKLPLPTGTQAQHQFIRIGDSKVSCVQCRFMLRNMKRKGERAPLTRYGCEGPGCSFSFCKDCYNTRHAGLPVS